MKKLPPHPSGRPIRHERTVGRTVWRIPDKGSVIPRLQQERRDLHLVGFHHEAISALRRGEDE